VTPELSVVIVTFHSREELAVCLESLDLAATMPHECIVIDNASGDGTVEWLRAHRPEVRVIENADNLGFARAVNQGLEQATGETVLLLNPDSRVTKEGIERLLETLRDDRSLAAAAPMLRDDHGEPARSCGRDASLWTLFCEHLGLAAAFPHLPAFAGYKYGGVPLQRLRNVGWASGAALLMARHALERVGGLDGGYFMYMEEVDWCRRARRAGLRVRFVPEVWFVHSGQHAAPHAAGRTYLYNLHSRVRYFRKHHGPLAATTAKGILALSLAIKWGCARLGDARAGDPGVYARGLEAVWAA